MCERWAYYGWFILVTVYLTSTVGYSDIQAGYLTGIFAALLYLLPFLSGAIADRIGYRPALMLALLLLTAGYAGMGLFPIKHVVLLPMALVMCGGALVKPIITGTVARASTPTTRARAFSLFYMMVNIGSFFGKGAAEPIRKTVGVGMVPILSATVTAIGFVCVALLYRPEEARTDKTAPSASVQDAALKLLRDLKDVLRSGRLMTLVPDPSDVNDRRARMRAWMSTALFDRIGMHPIVEFDPQGAFYGSSLYWATARDYARFGYLYLRDGVWNGDRVLPEGWVDFARTPGPAQNTDTYGAQWWLMAAHGPGRPSRSLLTNPALANAFAAEGHEGQLIVVVPSKDLVMVRLGRFDGGSEAWDALGDWAGRLIGAFGDRPQASGGGNVR
jgi:MFS family permease